MNVSASLFALFGVCALILALYLLKPPVFNRSVGSILIWRRVLQTSTFISERWRWWLSLIIALIIASSILLAALRPNIDGPGSNRLLVILDNAPSMGTLNNNGQTRFDTAKQILGKLLDEYSKDVLVMLVDTQRQVITPAFRSIPETKQLIEDINVGNSMAPVVPSQIGLIAASRKVVLTDGVLLGQAPDDFEVISLFQPVQNVGITKLSFSSVPGAPDRRQALIEVFNAGDNQAEVEIQLTQASSISLVDRMILEPFQKYNHIVDATDFDSGPVKASVFSPADRFSEDDTAFGYVTNQKDVKVALVTSVEDSKLMTLLKLMPRLSVQSISIESYNTGYIKDELFDVLILDGVEIDKKPTVPSIVFGLEPKNWSELNLSESRSTQLSLEKVNGHPILKNVGLVDLLVEKTSVFKDVESSNVLLQANEGSVIAITDIAASNSVLFGFNFNQSNLGLLADFPILLANMVTWLVDEPPILSLPPGVVKLGSDVTAVFGMSGQEMALWSADDHVFFNAQETGLYTAFTSEGPLRVSVSQLDPRFSQVNFSSLSSEEFADADLLPGEVKYSFPVLLGILALILLIVEWFLYHRRLTQ